jgi:ribosomal protein S4E
VSQAPLEALHASNNAAVANAVQHNDTVMLDIETGKVKDFVKFGPGNLCMITGGANGGRVGTIVHEEKHKGSFEIVHIRDAAGEPFTLMLVQCVWLAGLPAWAAAGLCCWLLALPHFLAVAACWAATWC